MGDDGARGGAGFSAKEVKRWVLDAMLGFAAGVMIAAGLSCGAGYRRGYEYSV